MLALKRRCNRYPASPNTGFLKIFYIQPVLNYFNLQSLKDTVKVNKYKVISTIFNDDIYGIEIIYLQERLHVLVNILAMGCLV
jgi:hypothetical protein